MNNIYMNTKIRVSIPYLLIWMILITLFFHRFIIQLGAPDAIKYILDILNIVLFVCAIHRKRKVQNIEKIYLLCYACMLFIGTVSAVINIPSWGWSGLYYLYDCRAIIRFILFFFSCEILLTNQMIMRLFKWILIFHVLNSIYIIYQYFTLEVAIYWMRGDNLNGFFGTSTGGNAYVNVLLIAVTVIVIYWWINKLCSTRMMLFFLGLNLIISTLIELKAFYIEFVIMIIYFALPYIKRITAKQFIIGCCIACGCMAGTFFLVHWLYRLYPWMEGTFASIGELIKAGSSNESAGDIGRITFLKDTYIEIFHKNIADTVMGIGLGTANTNGEMTKLARLYYNQTHYSWLSSSYILVETGIIGLAFYICSFFSLMKTSKKKLWRQITIVACLMSIFLIAYNETFRTEAGYLMFFLISTVHVKDESTVRQLRENK